MTQVLDHGYVRPIEHWGSDERIIEAARMSTAKGFQGWGDYEPCRTCDGRGRMCVDWDAQLKDYVTEPCTACAGVGGSGTKGDERLLRYLWANRHATPFEMAGLVVEVQAPIFVFREWHRHRTQSYNELSARYTEVPELYYVPDIMRLVNGAQSKTNRQGSGEPMTPGDAQCAEYEIQHASEQAFETYRSLLSSGVAREIARLVLPVNTYSRMRASACLRNWLSFLTLRLDEAAQWEMRVYADAVGALVAERFPRTWALFEEGRAV